jgi:hypothetical protein
MSARTITVQVAQTNQQWRVSAFENIPLDAPVVITIDAVGPSPSALEWCQALCASLASQIVGLGARPAGSIAEGAPQDPLGLSAASETRLVVGLVLDLLHASPQAIACHQAVLRLGQGIGSILPILRWPDRTLKLEHLLPQMIGEINADFVDGWDADPDPIADHLLAIAGVTTPDRRVFISYRRDETAGLASQLHSALVKANFDVFLDTVDVPPAAPFQAALLEELGNKAMVVLLDSPRYSASHWCQQELRFAEKHDLGLLVLRTPPYSAESGTVEYATRLQPVIPASVIELSSGQFEDPAAAATARRLDEKRALPDLVLEIKLEHQRAFVHRKRQLQANIVASFQAEGMVTAIKPGGLVEAGFPGHPASVSIVAATHRRPELHEFQRCHAACPAGTSLVAFLAALPTHRRSPYAWLGQMANVTMYDLVQIPEMTRHLSCMSRP